MSRRDDICWAAGLFEGEGCIALRKGKAGGVLILRMTDQDIVERFARIAGCGRIHGPLATAKPHHKPNYEWRCSKWEDVTRFLSEMLPLLGQRRSAKAAELFARPIGMYRRELQERCKRGHPLAGPDADVYVHVGGRVSRQCRPCNRVRNAEMRELRAA